MAAGDHLVFGIFILIQKNTPGRIACVILSGLGGPGLRATVNDIV